MTTAVVSILRSPFRRILSRGTALIRPGIARQLSVVDEGEGEAHDIVDARSGVDLVGFGPGLAPRFQQVDEVGGCVGRVVWVGESARDTF
ncbi:hypothetical protein, partial [Ilumatobacter sp.]|uniref:hypothetical protein n=1 Tax=Ilumatobacter sp. TaxID=1967498 RepID=UPI003C774B3E